jgi:hypothetical protein
MSLFSSRSHYPFHIRISGLLVVSSAFLTWELLAHPCFCSDLARCWLLHFFVSIYPAFSMVTAQSIRTPAHFFFHGESTRLAPNPIYTRPHHSSPQSGSMCHYYCPHAWHAFATLAIGISFSISIISTLSISTRDGAVPQR